MSPLKRAAALLFVPVCIWADSISDPAARASLSSGDNAWVLMSAALVLLMTGPGLALFYAGLVRQKNVLGTMMQSFAMMAIVSLVWALCGYSLVFSERTPFLSRAWWSWAA